MEVLTAFVRKQVKVSPKTTEKATEKQTASTQTSTDNELIPPPPTDIQAVLTVIRRRQLSDEHGENYNRLNLINTNLRHVRLSNANLQGALLFNANLQGEF